jgi:hypothetical protein
MPLIIIMLSVAIVIVGASSFDKSVVIPIAAILIGISGIIYGIIRAKQNRSIL